MPSASTLTAKRPVLWMLRSIFALLAIEIATRGGSSETDMKALAVMP